MPKIMSTQDMKCQNLLRKELHTSGTALQGRPTIAFTLSLNFDIWVVNFVGSILYICLILSLNVQFDFLKGSMSVMFVGPYQVLTTNEKQVDCSQNRVTPE